MFSDPNKFSEKKPPSDGGSPQIQVKRNLQQRRDEAGKVKKRYYDLPVDKKNAESVFPSFATSHLKKDEIEKMIDTINSSKIPKSNERCKNCAYAFVRSKIEDF